MDFATTDLLFAIGHHLLIFALAGVIAYEVAAVQPGMTAADVVRVARVDLWYGILAVLIIAVGFARANFAAQGLGVLFPQPFLLGEDRNLCACGRAVDLADAPLHALARGAEEGSCHVADTGRDRDGPQVPVGGSVLLRTHSRLRRRDGARLRRDQLSGHRPRWLCVVLPSRLWTRTKSRTAHEIGSMVKGLMRTLS